MMPSYHRAPRARSRPKRVYRRFYLSGRGPWTLQILKGRSRGTMRVIPQPDSHNMVADMVVADRDAVLVPMLATVGVVLIAVGIGRVRLRWLAAGAGTVALAALLTLFNDREPWESIEVVTLRIRAIDAVDGSPVVPGSVKIVLPGGGADSISTVEPDGVVRVFAVVEVSGQGFVARTSDGSGHLVDVGPLVLVVAADGYQVWQMPLARLLPRDWPLVEPQAAIEVRLQRDVGQAF